MNCNGGWFAIGFTSLHSILYNYTLAAALVKPGMEEADPRNWPVAF